MLRMRIPIFIQLRRKSIKGFVRTKNGQTRIKTLKNLINKCNEMVLFIG